MCSVIDFNQTHPRLALCNVITSAWFEDVVMIVWFCERQEIAVLPNVNIYSIWNLPLCGYDK